MTATQNQPLGTVGTPTEIKQAQHRLEDLQAKLGRLPTLIDEAFAAGNARKARQLDDDLQIALRQVNDAEHELARLQATAVDLRQIRANLHAAKEAAWCAAEAHHPIQTTYDAAILAWQNAEHEERTINDLVRNRRIIDISGVGPRP